MLFIFKKHVVTFIYVYNNTHMHTHISCPQCIHKNKQNYYIQRFSGYRWRGLGDMLEDVKKKEERGSRLLYTHRFRKDRSNHMDKAEENQSPPWDLLYERAVNVIEQFDAVNIYINVLDSFISSRYFNLDIFFRYS